MKRIMLIAPLCALILANAANAQQASPVRVNAAQLESVQQLRQVTGNVRAITRSRVAAIEPGRVIEFAVLEGQLVKAGEQLARLDAERLEIQLRQIEADISVQQALLEERIAQVELRESDLELIQGMQQRNATNPKELNDARLELRVAQSRRDQAERELHVRTAQADLLRRRISDMMIAAPFDGVVVSRSTELGEWVVAGSPIVELVSTGSFDVWLDVPQRFATAVDREGFSMMVRVDAVGMTFESRGGRIVGDIDPMSRTFALVVRIDESTKRSSTVSHEVRDETAPPRISPGMSVTAWIPTEDLSQQMTVHKDAVLRNEAGAFVYVVRNAGENQAQVVPVPVEIVFALEQRFVVRSASLAAGDHCVIEGGERLRPGSTVRIVGEVSRLAEGAVTP